MVSAAASLTTFRWVTSLSLLLLVVAHFIGSGAAADQPGAFVYRGPNDDPELSKAVGELLESSPRKFSVKYVGPDDITANSLESIKLIAFPGGPDLQSSWAEIEPVAQDIRDFVANGGRYLGFCLGAYLAGHSPGLALLPDGTDITPESDEKDAQVKDARDTVIQVDWQFSSGPNMGKTVNNRWVYFQEGSVVKSFVENDTSHVLARYSSTGDVAATINKYGQGLVGTTGPHPEANQLWFDSAKVRAIDGLQFKIGYDLIEATMTGGKNVKGLPFSRLTKGNRTGTNTRFVASAGSRPRNLVRGLFQS
ncbi:hypothetical protein LMH87_001598 [Akanthomyces muscarius]|uniref:Biotin-protein ligase N-terminal domain-containing protein n=1 Tax=Akanthomyces muscarius TaxID=2231603 RepID=A0A9W8Q4L6_AKAMU|nr:hypothetical protein LMH87_001598 [Akanthomyces muscarius]KAJ4147045.1 hypothetical protein LMH87_001598 [Akanthomyces muscarius]